MDPFHFFFSGIHGIYKGRDILATAAGRYNVLGARHKNPCSHKRYCVAHVVPEVQQGFHWISFSGTFVGPQSFNHSRHTFQPDLVTRVFHSTIGSTKFRGGVGFSCVEWIGSKKMLYSDVTVEGARFDLEVLGPLQVHRRVWGLLDLKAWSKFHLLKVYTCVYHRNAWMCIVWRRVYDILIYILTYMYTLYVGLMQWIGGGDGQMAGWLDASTPNMALSWRMLDEMEQEKRSRRSNEACEDWICMYKPSTQTM